MKLEQHILKFISLTDAELQSVLSYFNRIETKKKELLLKEGQLCRYNYFVESGCLRMYFIDDKGVEKTVQFAIEKWWISDYFSFQQQSNSEFYIQAIESSGVLGLTFPNQEKLLEEHPKMERYFRMIHQTAHAASQMRGKYNKDFSREEQFRHFNANFPEFVQRVPQYMLASYLGITPEYLSELRARIVS